MAFSGPSLIPTLVIKLDGTNYRGWASFTKVNLDGQRIWEIVTGERPCPLVPVPPPLPAPRPSPSAVTSDDEAVKVATKAATKEAVDAVVAADEATKAYQYALDSYECLRTDNARVMSYLVQSVDGSIFMDILEMPTAQQMWDHLQQHYPPSSDALYSSLLQQLQAL